MAETDPLEGTDRLIVDGTNVLHALRRSPTPLPSAALIGRLRAIVPPEVSILVVLDGSPEHGLVARRIASGVQVLYSGRESADAAIVRILELRRDGPPEAVHGTLVVTDDYELGHAVRRHGARSIRNAWLLARLSRQRLVAPSVARPRAPAPQGQTPGGPAGQAARDAGEDTTRWAPGRNATRKRGNGRRPPKGRPA